MDIPTNIYQDHLPQMPFIQQRHLIGSIYMDDSGSKFRLSIQNIKYMCSNDKVEFNLSMDSHYTISNYNVSIPIPLCF